MRSFVSLALLALAVASGCADGDRDSCDPCDTHVSVYVSSEAWEPGRYELRAGGVGCAFVVPVPGAGAPDGESCDGDEAVPRLEVPGAPATLTVTVRRDGTSIGGRTVEVRYPATDDGECLGDCPCCPPNAEAWAEF